MKLSDDLKLRLYTVKGRVQGVWFRDSTRRRALELGISGYAKNLSNGDVEVLASGDDMSLKNLRVWLSEGPPMAAVSEVREQELEQRDVQGFTIV